MNDPLIWDIDPTLIGPYELPWHGLFVLLEIGGLAIGLYQGKTKGRFSLHDFFWVLVFAAAHLAYTIMMAEDRPNFDLEIRWYGLFFAVGLLGGARAMPIYFEQWGFPRKHAEALTLWTPIGMLLGAHLIHLVFYEPEVFTEGRWIRIIQLGSGLASHGGGLGAAVALLIFSYREKVNPLKYIDAAMCAATWVIPWVRVGNFFNSEIVGRPWDGPWAVAFVRHRAQNEAGTAVIWDCTGSTAPWSPETICDNPITRHPSQVYEALLAFVMLGMAIYLQAKWRKRLRPGAILFILLGYYFTTRFFIEWTKEYQQLSDSFPLTMGQCLSVPIVLFSLYMLLFSRTSNIVKPYTPPPDDDVDDVDDEEAPKPKRRRRKKKPGTSSADKTSKKKTSKKKTSTKKTRPKKESAKKSKKKPEPDA